MRCTESKNEGHRLGLRWGAAHWGAGCATRAPPAGAGDSREGGSGCGRRRPESGAARPYPRSTSCCPRLRTRLPAAAALPAPSCRYAAAGWMPPAPPGGRTGGGDFCCPAAPCAQSARQPSHRKQSWTQSHRRLPILLLSRW